MTISTLTTYRNEKPYPFCPGCGHGSILDTLDEALVEMGVAPSEVVIVSDIGCAGLSDQYFSTSAFHGLHGRSITYATGIKLARPELNVIVIMGDGGTGIGGTHLINAARRNAGITVLVLNNLNFGMTGGQHSTTTPFGSITSTTPLGNIEHPLDICATVGVNGAGYVYRGTSFDPDLADRLVAAIRHPGFALLDIWDLCSAYFVPKNRMGKKGLDRTRQELGLDGGVLYEREVEEYGSAYRTASEALGERRVPRTIPTEYSSDLKHPFATVVAGSAGAKVRSAAKLFGDAAIRSGLWAMQRGDYPVTVKSGHSVSEVVLSPEPVPAMSVPAPDALAIASDDGLRKVIGALEAMGPDSLVVALPEFADVETRAQVVVLDPARFERRLPRVQVALALLTAIAMRSGVMPVEALHAAAAGPFEAENLNAIEAGVALSA